MLTIWEAARIVVVAGPGSEAFQHGIEGTVPSPFSRQIASGWATFAA